LEIYNYREVSLNTKIRLPVVRSLKIEDYPMFPGSGSDSKGFEHKFQSGLNVIVGVNGLGKTTLLNILFRTLVGPYDPRKSDLLEPGSKLHALTELKRFNYFALRIGTDARNARVTLELAFENDVLKIVRNLGPALEVLELRHNKTVLEAPNEQRYLDKIRELSRIESEYDWDFVVRNLIFFFEDKVPLIWNPKGQFEILRIMFLDQELSKQCADLHDKIMGEDSQTRNLAWHIESVEEELAKRLASLQDSVMDVESLPDLQRAKQDLAQEVALMEHAETDLQQRLVDLESQIFTGNVEVYEQGSALERTRLEYLRNAFPRTPEVTQVVLGRLFSEDHCIVCNNPSTHGRERLRKLTESQRCPVCETPLQESNKVISSKRVSDTRLRAQEEKLRDREQAIRDLGARKNEVQSELLNTQQVLNERLAERSKLEQRIDRGLALAGQDSGSGSSERALLAAQKRELDTRVAALARMRRRYDALLEKARNRIGEVANQIVKSFGDFSGSFILEDCKLTYTMDTRPIGQGGIQLKFPSFDLHMTSAVLDVASPRHEHDQVSESQKEFIDLAFRMALLRVACESRGALLVIETPEASLDSIFVDRAGEMLHDFAHGRGRTKNQIIATSNLNRENMIPALLGLREKGKIKRASPEVQSRVLNLLELAAPSKAYKANRVEYNKNYRDALGL